MTLALEPFLVRKGTPAVVHAHYFALPLRKSGERVELATSRVLVKLDSDIAVVLDGRCQLRRGGYCRLCGQKFIEADE